MRYELSEYEWTAIKPMLPNKARGVRRKASSGSYVQVLRGATPLVAFHRGGAKNDSLLSFPKARGRGPSFAGRRD